jgi:hypothetical protein
MLAAKDLEIVSSGGLRVLVEHVVPGRCSGKRKASPGELTATLIVELPLTEGVGKLIRIGTPNDDEDDHLLSHWTS